MNERGLILIVEDDEINREILKGIFADTYDIVEAENGREALEVIREREERLLLIILDLYMPVMDGYAVLEALGKHEKWNNIPVIISTAESGEDSDLRLVELGACHIIHKPVNAGIVKKQIINIVDNYQKHRESVREHMLEKFFISNGTNTFLCTYHFNTGSFEIGENYREFVGEDFPHIFDSVPFCLDRFTLSKDAVAVRVFFDVQSKVQAYDEMEMRLRVDAAHYEWFKVSMMVHYEPDKILDNVIFLFTHIEEEVEAKRSLIFLANNDVLTKIPNRRTFSEDVSRMLAENPDEKFIMMTMDIYRFRLVDKLFGYSEGDNVLKYLAIKLQEIIETFPKGIYCRMASDIFFACIPGSENADALMRTLQACMHEYPLKFDLKLCFGIYNIEDREESVETMTDHASYARRDGKENLLRSICYYDDALKQKEDFETVVTTEMEQALRDGQFEVYLQPKCETVTQKIIGAEALIRWKHPEKGFLSPGIFIPIFEKNGLVIELDYYVHETVCRTIRGWLDRGITPPPVSVNVSRCDLYDASILSHILETVEKYQIPHRLIEFEITESAFVRESELLLDFTGKLRKEGFRVLIDDFGSGYSSLNSLTDMVTDELKIDIKLLPVSFNESRAKIILSSVIEMAQRLGLDIIAEGVETKEQVEFLRLLGCTRVQGFYYYKPMPIPEFEACYARTGSCPKQ